MDAEDSDTHPIFHKNPADYIQYVYKEVCIEAKDGTTHTGHLYTIDPVSESMVLVQLRDDKVSGLKLIMGHAVEAVTVLNEDTEALHSKLDSLFKVNMHRTCATSEDLEKSKNRLRLWLLKNRLPISECSHRPDVLSLSDSLFIEPPYEPENCCSTNEIILGRVQGLIKNMPKNVDDW